MPYTIEIFYATCAIVGLIFTLFSAIISHSGHNHLKLGKLKLGKLPKIGKLGKLKIGRSPTNTSNQTNTPLNTQFTSLSVINPLTFAIFLGLFGLVGLITTIELKMGVTNSLIVSSLTSLLVSVSFSWVITKTLTQAQSTSVTNSREAIGLRAKVVTKIEKGRLGSISYIDKGTILTLPACSEEEETIERGDEVYIAYTDGKMAYVKREREGLWR